jgi:hypothetical protein
MSQRGSIDRDNREACCEVESPLEYPATDTQFQKNLHEVIHDPRDVDSTFVPTRFGCWDQEFDLAPLFVCQVMDLRQPATIMAYTSLVCPYRAPRESVPCIE